MANGLYAAIAEGGKPIQLENPLNQMAKMYAVKQAQTQNALAEQQQRQMMEEEAAYRTAGTDVNRLQAELMSRGLGRQALAVGAQMQKSQADRIKMLTDRAKLMETEARNIMATPTLTNALERVQAFSQSVGVDPTPVITQLQTLGDNPDAIRQWAAGYALSADKLLPQFQQFNQPGAGVVTGTVNPVTGRFMPGQTFAPQPKPPEIEEQEKRIRAAGRAPGATVNLPPQEKAEQVEFGKFLVDRYKTISDTASKAARALPAMDAQQQILDRGFKTGFGTEAKKAGASILAALGVPEAENFATNAQQFYATTQEAVLGKQLDQKGAQSTADSQRITQTGAQLGNTVAANRFIISVAKAQLKRDIAQRDFYTKWRRDNKTLDGAEDAWFSGEGNKSLFETPELRQYVTPAAPAKPRGGGARGGTPAANVSSVREQADAILGRE
jgi:hypothetical protein